MKTFTSLQHQFSNKMLSKKKLITYLKHEKNDLENAVIKYYPNVGKIIDFIKVQNGCYFSRITGSGSACIGVFSNMKTTISIICRVL